MWKEFKEFAFKGNVLDLAVGVIIGGAFGKIVTSVVNDLLMPLIGLLFGKMDFSSLFIPLDGNSYAHLADAKAANAPIFAYGSFITALIDFLIIAICIFFMIKGVNKLQSIGKKKAAGDQEKDKEPRVCPYCFSEIDERATRCPHCTSLLEGEEEEAEEGKKATPAGV